MLEGSRQPEPHRTRRRLAQRRKRRHAAEPQPEEQYPPSEPLPEPPMPIDPIKGNRVRYTNFHVDLFTLIYYNCGLELFLRIEKIGSQLVRRL